MSDPSKRRYLYRREPTAGGLDKIARGELSHFDLEMYANLNTGVLEEHLEEKNRRDGFAKSRWDWRQMLVGVAVGSLFALINTYVGLKVGLIVYGAWYVVYLVGLTLAWRPWEINLAGGAANGAAFMVTGFVYVFPAIFLLSTLNAGQYEPIIGVEDLPSLAVAIVATVVAGLLGLVWFIAFRRVWLVEDPLPYPMFESFVKLLDMTNDASAAAAGRARHSVRLVGAFAGVSAAFTFLRDFPLVAHAGERVAVLSWMLRDRAWYSSAHGLATPAASAHWTWLSFSLSPLLLATGWFMRARAAIVVASGTIFTWLVAIPLAVWFNVPVFVPDLGGDVGLADLWAAGYPSALLANGGLVRTMAAGAILGGGLTALFRMTPTFVGVARDLFRLGDAPSARSAYVPGRGWFEWPPVHILVMVAVALVAIPLAFVAGGYPLGASVFFAVLLVATSFLLGAIACKVLGETSIEPVSGTSFIVFLLLFGAFNLLGMPLALTVAMGLLGTSVYATAIAMTGNILLDFKNAIYVGTTPAAQMRAAMTGVIPGAVAGVLSATLLSVGLARGDLDLAAPQANAFATLASAIVGGQIDYTMLLLGVAFGVLVEVATGLGTAFGLGMFLPLGLSLPLLAGGLARDAWEKRALEPRAKREAWTEERKTIRLLDTYMVATGLIVGEALVGTLVAIVIAAGLLAA